MHNEKGNVASIRTYESMVRRIAQHPGPSGFAEKKKTKLPPEKASAFNAAPMNARVN